MDINIFHYMEEIKNHKTISSAARRLYLTQPALTNAIKRLEQELGVTLINRDVYPIQFTEAGDIFLKYATEITKMEERMHDALDACNKGSENIVRLAVTSAGITAFIKYQEMLHTRFPNVNFEITEYNSAGCEEKLVYDAVDLVFLTMPVLSEGLMYKKVGESPMVFITSKSNNLLKDVDLSKNSLQNKLPLSSKELNKETFFVTPMTTGLYRYTVEFFTEKNIVPASFVQMDSITGCYRMAETGAGMLLVSESSVARRTFPQDETVYCSFGREPQVRYLALAKKKNSRSKIIDSVYNAIPSL